ncbi:MAG TPA: 2-(1,2-epoxy-1,2-dihydrophenyl)acetyl-CoA isomerase, partial [Porticoccaceae bacterium]|nr:2-(1,2-epoxy-1,2-dihydrophenyl)acetyl-CoA isomerase [Porticoccaceae bacterium]
AAHAMYRAVRAIDKPAVAAFNGVAAGAGSAIALMCDIILAARSASFVPTFTKIGLMPDAGGTWYWPRLAGRGRAMAALLLAEKVSAEQAAEWGMIWKVVDDEALATESETIARRLAEMPPLALAKTKQAMLVSSTHTLEEQLAVERESQIMLGDTEDYAEGVKAFFEKRKPVFKGQ